MSLKVLHNTTNTLAYSPVGFETQILELSEHLYIDWQSKKREAPKTIRKKTWKTLIKRN